MNKMTAKIVLVKFREKDHEALLFELHRAAGCAERSITRMA